MEFQWATEVASYGLKEQRNELWSQPKRWWFIDYGALTEPARNRLNELFNRARGRAETFLLFDRDDFLCDSEEITTDGSAATYQLCKTYYSGETEKWTEDKKDIMPGGIYAPVVTHDVDGAQTEVAAGPGANEFTLDDTTGIMTWSGGNEPSAGTLTVTFQFYFRVRWTFDKITDSQFAPGYWRPANRGPHLVEVVG
jgi:uncharacterized protein (TIGR02217 family)